MLVPATGFVEVSSDRGLNARRHLSVIAQAFAEDCLMRADVEAPDNAYADSIRFADWFVGQYGEAFADGVTIPDPASVFADWFGSHTRGA